MKTLVLALSHSVGPVSLATIVQAQATSVYIYIYIYIYRERERERESITRGVRRAPLYNDSRVCVYILGTRERKREREREREREGEKNP